MTTVVIPMAGRGSRLASADGRPKMLVPVADGRSVLAWSLRTLGTWGLEGARWVFVCLERHLCEWALEDEIARALPGIRAAVVPLPDPLEGPLCSVLAARRWLADDDPLVIHSCDTYARGRRAGPLPRREAAVAGIPVFPARDPAYSYVRLDGRGYVREVVEKRVCPPGYATAGTYVFRSARLFLGAAEESVSTGGRVNGEFYVSAVYGALVRRGERFRPLLMEEVWPIGTLAELDAFNARLRSDTRCSAPLPTHRRTACSSSTPTPTGSSWSPN